MALDEYVENLEQRLDSVQDQILRDLLSKGYRLCEVESSVAQVKDSVRDRYLGSALSNQQLGKELTDAVVTQVMARGFALSARLVSNTLAVRGRLNPRQALCLWLGLFFEQSSCVEGLWQMYVDYRSRANGTPLAIPEFITEVCGPADSENAQALQDRILDYWEEQLERANQAMRSSQRPALEPSDIPSLIAWILATRFHRQSPDAAIEGMDRMLSGVYNDLRRGYHTLLCKYLEDVYDTIGPASGRHP